MLWATALAAEASFASLLVVSKPFPQRRARNATATAGQAGISGFLVQLDPLQSFLGFIVGILILQSEMMSVNHTFRLHQDFTHLTFRHGRSISSALDNLSHPRPVKT